MDNYFVVYISDLDTQRVIIVCVLYDRKNIEEELNLIWDVKRFIKNSHDVTGW